jgi:hypothetical protein
MAKASEKKLRRKKEGDPDNNGQKNAPSLAAWGKSTFSEGGGDKQCVQKSTLVLNST